MRTIAPLAIHIPARSPKLSVLVSLTLVSASADCSGAPSSSPEERLYLSVVSGWGQAVFPSARLDQPYVVRVTRHSGTPVAGESVRWDVLSGAGLVEPEVSTTDSLGLAQTFHTLGSQVGAQQVRAAVVSDASAAVTLTATADPQFLRLVSRFPTDLHDTFVREGIAFLSAWDAGIIILDVGTGIRGGSPATPVEVSRIVPSAGALDSPAIHNAWWFHNPVTQEKRYLFVGQEGPHTESTSSGDIKVLDVSDLANPREVAFFHLEGAGTHNFWMDEPAQVLYAAYFNAGVVALDVSGVLQGDLAGRLRAVHGPGGTGNTHVWGVMLADARLYAIDELSGFWQLDPVTLRPEAGGNNVPERFSSDLWVSGSHAYTGTVRFKAGSGGTAGAAVKIWQLGPTGAPTLVDSVIVPETSSVTDLEVSDNSRLLVLSTEGDEVCCPDSSTQGGVYVYSLRDAGKPVLVGRVAVAPGVHTVSLARIGGKLFAFATRNHSPMALEIYDLSAFDIP